MIGIIGAMDVEINALASKLEHKEEINVLAYKFYKGILNNKEVVILKSGIGKVSSAVGCALMLDHFKPSIVINTGIAGGLNGLKQYDILLASELSYSDVDATNFGYKLGQVPQMPEVYKTDDNCLDKIKEFFDKNNISYKCGNVLSSDSFIVSEKQLLVKRDGFVGCEMEGASIAQTCYINKTPFVSIRFISDVVGGSNQAESYMEFEAKAANLSQDICYKVLEVI